MANNTSVYDLCYKLMSISFFSTIIVGIALISYGAINDFILFPLFEVVNGIITTLGLDSWVPVITDSTLSNFAVIPGLIDIMWLLSFASFIGSLFIVAYNTKRTNYFTALSYILLGSMLFMFVSGLFLVLSDWFLEEIVDKMLSGIIDSTPIFKYYITNAGIFNLLIFGGLVFTNFADFDFNNFFNRKKKEKTIREEVF